MLLNSEWTLGNVCFTFLNFTGRKHAHKCTSLPPKPVGSHRVQISSLNSVFISRVHFGLLRDHLTKLIFICFPAYPVRQTSFMTLSGHTFSSSLYIFYWLKKKKKTTFTFTNIVSPQCCVLPFPRETQCKYTYILMPDREPKIGQSNDSIKVQLGETMS